MQPPLLPFISPRQSVSRSRKTEFCRQKRALGRIFATPSLFSPPFFALFPQGQRGNGLKLKDLRQRPGTTSPPRGDFVLQNSTTGSPPLTACSLQTAAFYLALFWPFWAADAVFARTGDFRPPGGDFRVGTVRKWARFGRGQRRLLGNCRSPICCLSEVETPLLPFSKMHPSQC
jgi:hypothetical protein